LRALQSVEFGFELRFGMRQLGLLFVDLVDGLRHCLQLGNLHAGRAKDPAVFLLLLDKTPLDGVIPGTDARDCHHDGYQNAKHCRNDGTEKDCLD